MPTLHSYSSSFLYFTCRIQYCLKLLISVTIVMTMLLRPSQAWMRSSPTALRLLTPRTTAITALFSTTNSMTSSTSSEASIPRIKVKKLLNPVAGTPSLLHQEVRIQGWVRTVRDQKKFAFIEINDGSQLQGIQVIADSSLASYGDVQALTTGAAVEVEGKVVQSEGKGQSLELHAKKVTLIGDCPVDTYPLQKKRHSQEFLRSIAHLRARTNTISAVARVRSALAFATHQFFQSEGFVYLQSPLITSSDCEGAGEMFRVTTLPIDQPQALPKTAEGKTNFEEDFFGKAAYLTVSGQLSGETYACALGDIYTFGPTFRAEKSQTTRHLAEFHMIEPELAFADLFQTMDNAEAFVKYVVQYAMNQCSHDIDFFHKFVDKNLVNKLSKLISQPFVRIPYREAILLLQQEIAKDPSKWQYPHVEFGTDLQTEHERWLAEKHFQSCVFVHNYPRKIKAFYMRDNADGETVDSFDLLVPGVGELIGGSQREERLVQLQQKMKEFDLKEEDYEWYLDLRRFGSVPHSGYGLGFERLVCYVTGIENIREAIAYPRYPGHAEF